MPKPTVHDLIKAAPSALYGWEPNTRRYRNNRTGQFISREQMVELREDYLEQEKAINIKLAGRLFDREITLSEW